MDASQGFPVVDRIIHHLMIFAWESVERRFVSGSQELANVKDVDKINVL